MKKIESLLCLAVFFVLQGCASQKFNYRPVMMDVSEPVINSVTQKAVGEEMLKQGKFTMLDVLKVEVPIRVSLAYTVEPGIFRLTGSDETANYYQIGGVGDESGTVSKAPLADSYKSIMLKRQPKELCVVTIFSAYTCIGEIDQSVTLMQRPMLFENSLQQTLIYNGRIGNKISIGYREFSNNFARPAFNNNVDYDLSESKVIGYKGAEIEVIEATNRHIKYRVIRNFNSPFQQMLNFPADGAKSISSN